MDLLYDEHWLIFFILIHLILSTFIFNPFKSQWLGQDLSKLGAWGKWERAEGVGAGQRAEKNIEFNKAIKINKYLNLLKHDLLS